MSHVSRLRKKLSRGLTMPRVVDMDLQRDAAAEFAGKSVAVVVPSHDNNCFLFTFSLANMMGFTAVALPDDVSFTLIAKPGTYVHSARQELADDLVAKGFDYALWLDADMTFPPDLLVRLLLRQKDIVGINYAQRGVPARFTAIKKVGWDGTGSKRLVTNDKTTGVEEVDGIGFGAVLMDCRVLRALPDPKKSPWFFFEWLPDLGTQVGEDIWFCRLAKQHGFKIWVDHDMSKQCTHVGQWQYRCEHVQPEEY